MPEEKKKFITKQNRKPISVKLHPKTLRLLDMLASEIGWKKTQVLEVALWEAFSNKLMVEAKPVKKIQKILDVEFPKKSDE